jgi:hypothetical protein
VIPIHVALLTAVHEQVRADAITAMVPLPPLSPILSDVGEIVKVQGGGAACCDTVKLCPPTEMVPVRAAAVFVATVKLTVPLPVPVAGCPTVIHGAFDVAVHAHVGADAVTPNDPAPPASVMVWLAGEIVNVHGAGAAACVTVKVCPAKVTEPVRAAPAFAATLTPTLPLPVPAVRSIVIQAAPDAAVHAQVAADAVTATEPEPPPSATFWVVGEIEKVHVGVAAA